MEINNRKWFLKTDLLIISLLIIFGVISLLLSFGNQGNCKSYTIQIGYDTDEYSLLGKETQRINVSTPTVKEVKGKLGPVKIEFDPIKGVRVVESGCPCKVCINSGWIKNHSIVCIPNSLIVKPEFNDSDDKTDAVSY